MDRIEATVQARGEQLRSALNGIGLEVRDLGEHRSGIVTSTHPSMAAADVKAALTGHGINSSVSAPDSTLWDALRRDLPPLLRTSVHYTTTTEEIDQLTGVLRTIGEG